MAKVLSALEFKVERQLLLKEIVGACGIAQKAKMLATEPAYLR